MVFSIPLLVRIEPVPASIQFHQADSIRLQVVLRGHDNEPDLNVANIRGRIVGDRILAKHRSRGGITSELEDRLRGSPREHRRIGRLECGNLRGRSVVHYVGYVRKHDARRSSGGPGARSRRLGYRAAEKCSALQLIADPAHAITVVDVSFEDHVPIAGGLARSAAGCANDAGKSRDIAGVPAERPDSILTREGQYRKVILRRVSRITGVTNNLIQSEPGFLKRGEKLRLGAELLLGISQQGKHGAADDHENGHGDHQFNHRKTRLLLLLSRELHFSTMASRVTGRRGMLPPVRRTPTMNRLPVGLGPFAYVMTAHRTS